MPSPSPDEQRVAAPLDDLAGDERAILDLLADRLLEGRKTYGPWRVKDGRDYPREALHEAVDGLAYLAALLLRLQRSAASLYHSEHRVYVCHPASAGSADAAHVRTICQALVDEGSLPIAPQLYLPQFLGDEIDGDTRACVRRQLIGACDEVRVYGADITGDMRADITHARSLGTPVNQVGEQ